MPALNQLMGAYFHQDWEDDADDDMAIVDQFVASEPRLAPQLFSEITSLLATGVSESDLKRLLLDEMGSNYLADWDSGTYRGWLQQVADRARAATANTGR